MVRLQDLIHERPESLFHAFFRDKPAEEFNMEWKMFVDAFIPELIDAVKEHLDQLQVPAMNEVVTTRIFPNGFMKHIAALTDDHLPHWNLVERCVICTVVAREVYDTGAIMWRDMVRMKNGVTPQEAEASIQHTIANN